MVTGTFSTHSLIIGQNIASIFQISIFFHDSMMGRVSKTHVGLFTVRLNQSQSVVHRSVHPYIFLMILHLTPVESLGTT